MTFLGSLGGNSLGNTTGRGFLVNGSGPFFSGFVTQPTPRKELHKGQLVYTVLQKWCQEPQDTFKVGRLLQIVVW